MTQSDNNAGRIVGMGIAATGSVANQGINFYTCLSSVQSERMRINEQGNVGIGTASPSSALDVTGTVTSNKFTLKYAGTDTFATIEGPNNRSLRFDLKDNGTSDIFEFRNRALDSLLKIDNTGHLTPLGGVYLGGTAAANKLDDYEEGTFTVTSTRGGNAENSGGWTARYVKVGSLVHVTISTDTWVRHDNYGTGQAYVITSSLPFTPASAGGSQVAHSRTMANPEKIALSWRSGSATIYLNLAGANNGYEVTNNVVSLNGQSNTTLIWSGSFYTTS
jgi:hypothetical protein